MSVSHTEAAVVARTKTVTRRLGWRFLKPGDHVTLCRKVMGRKAGEPLVRLAEVEIVSVRREPLATITSEEILLEAVDPAAWLEYDGQPSPMAWARWFAEQFHCYASDDVTRIEWRYLA